MRLFLERTAYGKQQRRRRQKAATAPPESQTHLVRTERRGAAGAADGDGRGCVVGIAAAPAQPDGWQGNKCEAGASAQMHWQIQMQMQQRWLSTSVAPLLSPFLCIVSQ